MSSIVLGHAGRKAISLDIPTVLRTRLLITANSGGGKSWLLRRMAEQLFGKIQVIIIDPEGEFASLREKYGYVLVGKGGETPADVRSAPLLAHKLLELKASAVCDLYEMRSDDRHRWVKVFLDSMINAPKKLWHPVVVILDEAQMFCPEKGQGESEAQQSVASFATRARKRGFGPVLATQRLSILSKAVSALCMNRLIGQTFEDVDVERAMGMLSVTSSEKLDFAKQMRTLDPGSFYAFGRALCKERTLFRSGPVSTTHPDVTSETFVPEPPPAPEKVRRLLPDLADLPKQAEDQAKDMAGAKARIAELERELRVRPVQVQPEKVIERVEVQVVSDAQVRALTDATGQLAKIAGEISAALRAPRPAPARAVPALRPAPPSPLVSSPRPLAIGRAPANGKMPISERKILTALAQYPDGRTKVQLAVLTGYAVGGGGFGNALGALRTAGRIEGDQNRYLITEDGQAALGAWNPLPVGAELLEYWIRRLPKAESAILRVAADRYPDAVAKEEVAELTNYNAAGGGFGNALGRLRTLELIERRPEIRASDHLFG